MIAAIDCGTTKTRIILSDRDKHILARADRVVGARDTDLTGSKDYLIWNLEEMIREVLEKAGLPVERLELVVASGMITSELGLKEIPHLVAPVDKAKLAGGIQRFPARALLDLDVPVLLIPGVRNRYAENATPRELRYIDFMRGEEVQSVAVSERYGDLLPLNLVVLSSHTKIVHINRAREIVASCTTMSGQVYHSLVSHTLIGSALTGDEGSADGLSDDELIAIAGDVKETGFLRSLMMPRFMQVLLKTSCRERRLFFDAVIASDDMQAFDDMDRQGCGSGSFVLFGQEERCRLYETILKNKYGGGIRVVTVSDAREQEDMTLYGTLAVLDEYLKSEENSHV